jgi:4-carboxymuconolactone decarboxylase
MTISESAKAHHDQLFGDRVSTLAQTDPEFIAYFEDFAFGEVLADAADLDNGVDLHTRLLVQLAAVLAAGGSAEFRALATAALANAGATRSSSKSSFTRLCPTSAGPACTSICTP